MGSSSGQAPTQTHKLFIQMSGPPGSGKSTTAKLLAQALDAVVIDHDVLRSTILEHDVVFDKAAKLAYSLGWALAGDFMKQGRSVISDSTCFYKETLDQGSALAQQHGFIYRYVECKVDDMEVLDDRLRRRVPLRSQRRGVTYAPVDAGRRAQAEESNTVFKRWMERPCRPERHAIIVDSTRNPAEYLDFILEQI